MVTAMVTVLVKGHGHCSGHCTGQGTWSLQWSLYWSRDMVTVLVRGHGQCGSQCPGRPASVPVSCVRDAGSVDGRLAEEYGRQGVYVILPAASQRHLTPSGCAVRLLTASGQVVKCPGRSVLDRSIPHHHPSSFISFFHVSSFDFFFIPQI